MVFFHECMSQILRVRILLIETVTMRLFRNTVRCIKIAPVTTTRRKNSILASDVEKQNGIVSSKQQKMEDYPVFKINDGETFIMEMLPDPPGKVPHPDHVDYDASHEPKFDAEIHLNLEAGVGMILNVNVKKMTVI